MRWPSWDRQRFGMDGELAAFATVQQVATETFTPSSWGPVDLTFADVFHFRRVQGVDRSKISHFLYVITRSASHKTPEGFL